MIIILGQINETNQVKLYLLKLIIQNRSAKRALSEIKIMKKKRTYILGESLLIIVGFLRKISSWKGSAN